jgi:hypothetical protein
MKGSCIAIAGLVLAATASPAFADAAAIETLRTECAVQLNLPAPACDCIADKAGEMNDDQQAFVAAAVTKDEATTAALRGQMTVADLTEAAMFMTTSPQACMQGG